MLLIQLFEDRLHVAVTSIIERFTLHAVIDDISIHLLPPLQHARGMYAAVVASLMALANPHAPRLQRKNLKEEQARCGALAAEKRRVETENRNLHAKIADGELTGADGDALAGNAALWSVSNMRIVTVAATG